MPKNYDPDKWGVSFSAKQCRNFGIDPKETLDWLLKRGFRRFRLMSYWDECEPSKNNYNFTELDRQISQITKNNGQITLCLGVRQPRWPENHWPDWAWQSDDNARTIYLLKFIETVVKRYKDFPAVISYQLENEALLADFGERIDISRSRLRKEYKLVKQLDPTRPIIMTTSTAFGLPLIGPIPDIVGFSYYTRFFNAKSGKYHQGKQTISSLKIRAIAIKLILRKPSFIHELQAEPWGPKNIWDMSSSEQAKSMNPAQIQHNIDSAKASGLHPIDLWGAEWWYWKYNKHEDKSIWKSIRDNIEY